MRKSWHLSRRTFLQATVVVFTEVVGRLESAEHTSSQRSVHQTPHRRFIGIEINRLKVGGVFIKKTIDFGLCLR